LSQSRVATRPLTYSTSTPSAHLAPSSPSTRAITRLQQSSTRRQPQAGRRSGNVPERAYALLGQGRCLGALGRPEAEQPLREARDLFASMGYKPEFVEAAALLRQTAVAPARRRSSLC
jgi:hypothetical protein